MILAQKHTLLGGACDAGAFTLPTLLGKIMAGKAFKFAVGG